MSSFWSYTKWELIITERTKKCHHPVFPRNTFEFSTEWLYFQNKPKLVTHFLFLDNDGVILEPQEEIDIKDLITILCY